MGKACLEIDSVPVSGGIAIGRAYNYKEIDLEAVAKKKFHIENHQREIKRLNKAVDKSRAQLEGVRLEFSGSIDKKTGDIFGAQIKILENENFLKRVKKNIRDNSSNVEYVIANQIKITEARFFAVKDELIRTRIADIQDVYHRLLRNLLEIEHVRTNPLKRLTSKVILVSERMIPTDIALVEMDKISGIVIGQGSAISHVSIIAKSLGVPAVIRIPGINTLVRTGDLVVVDGNEGKLLVNPRKAELAAYHRKIINEDLTRKKRIYEKRIYTTRDGTRVSLMANVGSLREAELALYNGAQGIGLVRTELFYMSRRKKPTIGEETGYYHKLTKIMGGGPITIRLADFGADKHPSYLGVIPENNPQLGCRGIRFLLRNPKLLNRQIRSILSIVNSGKVKILLPFVSIVEDLKKSLQAIEEVCTEEKVDRKRIKIGMMVEVPSAALAIHDYMPKVDFLSIGTNDLTQYVFSASREDVGLESYHKSIHPVMLNLIKHIVLCAGSHEKDVSICGEVCSDPQSAALLVGLGVRILSMSPEAIPRVRDGIAGRNLKDLEKIANRALGLSSYSQVRALLTRL
jgi:phosphoenolpyruvate-protein phosphotransferase